jgi:hypothetical protein
MPDNRNASPAPPFFVLLDAENVSHALFGPQVDFAAFRAGVTSIRRAFGEARHTDPWRRYGFLSCTNSPGRNAADLSLTVYARDRAADFPGAEFMIITSDLDLAPVVHWLRARSHRVCGMGEAKAPRQFRAAYEAFQPLKRLTRTATGRLEAAVAVMRSGTAFAPSLAAQDIRRFVAALVEEAGLSGMVFDDLALRLARADRNPVFEGYPTLGAFLATHDDLFIVTREGAEQKVMLVRDPPHTVPGTAPPPPAPSFARPRA